MGSTVKTVKLKDLIPDPKNARVHSSENLDAISDSLLRYGAGRSIVIDGDGIVRAGNGTLEAAKEAGIENVTVIETDGKSLIAVKRSDWSPLEAAGYGIADNRAAELGAWDPDRLRETIAELQALDPQVDIVGFSEADLSELLKTEPEPETEPDEEPLIEPPKVAVTKPGDLWELGDHRLLCGDSTDQGSVDRLMNGEKADLVYTDPPYGMRLDTDFRCSAGGIHVDNYRLPDRGRGNYQKVKGDHDDFSPDLINAIFCMFNEVSEIFLWGADYYSELIPNRKDGSWIVWDKVTNAAGEESGVAKFHGSNFELCWSRQKHKREIARIIHKGLASVENDKREHPVQKPVKLALWFFDRWGGEAKIIVDLYAGSGSTLLACEQAGRKCRAMEIAPEYCDVIVRRWESLTKREARLIRDGKYVSIA